MIWCLDCKVPYHEGQTCTEYKAKNSDAEEKKDKEKFVKLVSEREYQT